MPWGHARHSSSLISHTICTYINGTIFWLRLCNAASVDVEASPLLIRRYSYTTRLDTRCAPRVMHFSAFIFQTLVALKLLLSVISHYVSHSSAVSEASVPLVFSMQGAVSSKHARSLGNQHSQTSLRGCLLHTSVYHYHILTHEVMVCEIISVSLHMSVFTQDGDSALMMAVRVWGSTEVVSLLLEARANTDLQNKVK